MLCLVSQLTAKPYSPTIHPQGDSNQAKRKTPVLRTSKNRLRLTCFTNTDNSDDTDCFL